MLDSRSAPQQKFDPLERPRVIKPRAFVRDPFCGWGPKIG